MAALRLVALVRSDPGLPTWDPASHGVVGLDLAHALRRADPLGFLATLNNQSLWPFVHSLLLMPFFLALGDDYATAEFASTVFYGLTVVAIFWAGLGLGPRSSRWIGTLAATFALCSPAFASFGSVAMLEIPGALLLASALACHAQSSREGHSPRWLAASGIAGAALFFCKYNYGLLWLVPLAGFEAGVHRPAERRALAGALRRSVRGGLLRRPIPLLLLAFLAFAVGLEVTGGFVFHWAGREVSVRSPGNAATAVYYVVVAWVGSRWLRHREHLEAAWKGVPARLRGLTPWVLIPIGAWFLVPPHLKEFVRFLVPHSQGPPPWTLEGLLYYPRAFLTDYSPTPLVGLVVLLLALAPTPPAGQRVGGARAMGAARDPRALLTLAMGLGLVATTLHSYHDPRFFFTTALLVWLRSAVVAEGWMEWAWVGLRQLAHGAARGSRPWRIPDGLWGLIVLPPLVWAAVATPALDRARAWRQGLHTPPRFAAVLDDLLADVERAGGGGVLFGYGNQLSPALLHWQATLRRAPIGRARLPELLWLPPGTSEGEARARTERLRTEHAPIFSALPETPDAIVRPETREEVRSDSIMVERLANDPGVRRLSDRIVPGTGYRLRTFRFSS
jgi:type II secretory pathway component PulM